MYMNSATQYSASARFCNKRAKSSLLSEKISQCRCNYCAETEKAAQSVKTHLIEIRIGLTLTYSVEIVHLNKLEIINEARIGSTIFWPN